MFRVIFAAVLGAASVASAPVSAPAQDGTPAPKRDEAALKTLAGRWEVLREETGDGGTVRRQWVQLDFAGSAMGLKLLDEARRPVWDQALDVVGVEAVDGVHRLTLGRGGRVVATVYYEVVGGRLVLVGSIPPRPFEGFSLSGAYRRVENGK
jgi:hypothetical protein